MPKNIRKLIGEQIRAKRKAANLSQQELAAEINYSDSAISAFENGVRSPSLYAAFNMAEAMGCSTEDFRPEVVEPFDF